MANATRFVGLDVHARESACALFDLASGEVQTRKISGRPAAALGWLEGLERPFHAVYEAGPTGYGLAREARKRGLTLEVCAPGHIRRHPTERIKTDKRDALKLARLLAAGDLHIVRVPEPEEEQLRDLVRCREDVRVDLMRTRHRLSKFCLRRELHFDGSRNWTLVHRDWLRSLRFDDRASELCFEDYLHAHDVLLSRRDRLEAELGGLVADSPWAPLVGRLRCLRGIGTLSAVGLCAESAASAGRSSRSPSPGSSPASSGKSPRCLAALRPTRCAPRCRAGALRPLRLCPLPLGDHPLVGGLGVGREFALGGAHPLAGHEGPGVDALVRL
jgi:transposase